MRAGRGTVAGQDGRLFPLTGDVYWVVFSYYAQLLGFGRVRFAPGERWPGALFCLGTLPAQLIAFPFLATSWNLILKRLGLERIEARLGELRGVPPDFEVAAETET